MLQKKVKASWGTNTGWCSYWHQPVDIDQRLNQTPGCLAGHRTTSRRLVQTHGLNYRLQLVRGYVLSRFGTKIVFIPTGLVHHP